MKLISCSKPALIPNPYSSLISRSHFHASRKTHHVIVHAKSGYAYGSCIEDSKFITIREKRENRTPDSGIAPLASLPETQEAEPTEDQQRAVDKSIGETQQPGGMELSNKLNGVASILEQVVPPQGFVVISACVVGLLTGMGVVLFNNAVHEIRDFFWDGIPSRGASWLREEPLENVWQRVILVPVCGGVMVGALNSIRNSLEPPSGVILTSNLKAVLRPFFKAVAAAVTLGTGNSLGPEGPSVEIGASIAKGMGALFEKSEERKLSLVASGSAAGISSGFNAAVAGCFFAVESVLWPSSADSSSSLANTTSMVILSAVIASVVSVAGLGSDPAFTVPEYDFRSPSELPLYLLLGVLCGLVSLTLSRCTSHALAAAENLQKATGITRAAFPVLGGLTVGLIALAYPEVLYWGFENVDILLESRPFVQGLPADLLLQLVGAKVVATSLCRASGLVGGYYAPSLFIGAATGMAYGKFASYAISGSDPIFHLSFLEVASPQAYGLVGMAATLAGVCQVPLTSVLLLFELTQDYRIVLPLLGAVGLSSWITSFQVEKKESGDKTVPSKANSNDIQTPKYSSSSSQLPSGSSNALYTSDLCELESSLCVDDYTTETKVLEERISVSQAMHTRYVTIVMSTLLTDAVTLMLAEKQSCALIIDDGNFLIGLITLGDILEFSKVATPSMNLLFAQRIMNRYRVNLLPVVSEHGEDEGRHLVGLLDRECIKLACRAMATKELLSPSPIEERLDS
ncbi:chloride channel protein CLC-e isoform X1 [Cinnamomum micranthum f. kanehirae]|uniref:Chloride channel protein n=1 Tax=Cinnamomum micranthum f. kanehirae TaxID=337451 RepID=A0A3S3PUR6_9MAGN|nr:chloride channel protein CLC-e isoform X1 [Cinnamomum micranthum f. kanehirae]